MRDRIVKQPAFDVAVFLCIAANTVTLALTNPLDTNESRVMTIETIDAVFTAVFALEMVLKMLALVSAASLCGMRTKPREPC